MEWGAELLEEDGVPRVGSIEEGWSTWESRLLNRAWIGRFHLPTALGRSSWLLCTRPPDQCLRIVQRAL